MQVDKDALTRVCRESGLVLVVLFGSRARGYARPDSDTDIGVLRREGLVPASRILDLAVAIGNATGLPDVHLVDLRRSPGLLQHHAGTYGRALFEDEPGRFNLFRATAWKLYLDEAHTFRRHDAEHIRETLARLKA